MPSHLTPTPHGVQARLTIRGVRYSRHFRRGTPDYAIQKWLLTTKLKHVQPGATAASGTFAADVAAYLASVAAMPTFQTRKQHIEEWLDYFGKARRRDTITPAEIAAALNLWRTTPRESRHGRNATRTVTLSASACNQRRTALMHLWATLDGRHAPNPVRAVPKFRAPATPPRALPYATIRAILAPLRASKTKARLLVLAHTGLPHAQIAQLTPADVNLRAKTVTVHGRRKGAGTLSSIRPLSREAVAAFKLFAQMEAWGRFSVSTLRIRFRAACVRAGVPPVTPYVLRHSYGTELLRLTGDLHATQALMGHSDPRQTQRYASGASDARLTAAIAALDGAKVGQNAKAVAKKSRKPKKTAR